jgi:hypothetical protein
LGRLGPFLAGLGRFLGLQEGVCELLESFKERGSLRVDGVGVADGEREEDGLVDEPADGGGKRLVDDFGLIQKEQGVIECCHDVLDLAVGGLGPLLGLGALSLDALLLGFQDLLGDTAFVVELDELLLLPGEFVQAAVVAV